MKQLIDDLVARKPGGHLVESRLGSLHVNLELDPSEAESTARFAEDLVSSIDRQLDDAIHHATAFRPGYAWCHRCARADCEDGLPPSSRHIFAGYAQTGLPQWIDFAQLCLEIGHPEVDRLYAAQPALLTVVELGHRLNAPMIEAFEDTSYRLLGQVSSGYFSLRGGEGDGRPVVALTIQCVATRAPGGSVALGWNLLGRSPSGEALHTLWDSHGEIPWRKALRWAQTALETLTPAARTGKRGRNPAAAISETRIDGILQGLARRLERDRRSRGRRTGHAQERHLSGERPTRKAIEDAQSARPEEILQDPRQATVVVLGSRGRTHFFTEGGQLVSSVRYSRDAIDRKLEREVWVPSSKEWREAFLQTLPQTRSIESRTEAND